MEPIRQLAITPGTTSRHDDALLPPTEAGFGTRLALSAPLERVNGDTRIQYEIRGHWAGLKGIDYNEDAVIQISGVMVTTIEK